MSVGSSPTNVSSSTRLSRTTRTAARTRPARFTNSSGRRVHASALARTKGVRQNRFWQHWSQISQLSKALRPAIHLRLRYPLRDVDQRGENPRLPNGAAPEREGEFVVRPGQPRDRAQLG